MIKPILCIMTCSCFLLACSSTHEKQYLPDGGPTSAQLYSGEAVTAPHSQSTNYSDNGQYVTKPLTSENLQSMSSISGSHLSELKQDFRLIPNPEVLGYVMPHFNRQSEIPVPGYFTVFKLYDREHYARSGEGVHE